MKSLDNSTGARQKRRMKSDTPMKEPKNPESIRIGAYALRLVMRECARTGLKKGQVVRDCILRVLGPRGVGVSEWNRFFGTRVINLAKKGLDDAAIDKVLAEEFGGEPRNP